MLWGSPVAVSGFHPHHRGDNVSTASKAQILRVRRASFLRAAFRSLHSSRERAPHPPSSATRRLFPLVAPSARSDLRSNFPHSPHCPPSIALPAPRRPLRESLAATYTYLPSPSNCPPLVPAPSTLAAQRAEAAASHALPSVISAARSKRRTATTSDIALSSLRPKKAQPPPPCPTHRCRRSSTATGFPTCLKCSVARRSRPSICSPSIYTCAISNDRSTTLISGTLPPDRMGAGPSTDRNTGLMSPSTSSYAGCTYAACIGLSLKTPRKWRKTARGHRTFSTTQERAHLEKRAMFQTSVYPHSLGLTTEAASTRRRTAKGATRAATSQDVRAS